MSKLVLFPVVGCLLAGLALNILVATSCDFVKGTDLPGVHLGVFQYSVDATVTSAPQPEPLVSPGLSPTVSPSSSPSFAPTEPGATARPTMAPVATAPPSSIPSMAPSPSTSAVSSAPTQVNTNTSLGMPGTDNQTTQSPTNNNNSIINRQLQNNMRQTSSPTAGTLLELDMDTGGACKSLGDLEENTNQNWQVSAAMAGVILAPICSFLVLLLVVIPQTTKISIPIATPLLWIGYCACQVATGLVWSIRQSDFCDDDDGGCDWSTGAWMNLAAHVVYAIAACCSFKLPEPTKPEDNDNQSGGGGDDDDDDDDFTPTIINTALLDDPTIGGTIGGTDWQSEKQLKILKAELEAQKQAAAMEAGKAQAVKDQLEDQQEELAAAKKKLWQAEQEAEQQRHALAAAAAMTEATATAEAVRAKELEEQVQQQTKELETTRATMRELEDRILSVLSETTTSSAAAAVQAAKIEELQAEFEAQKADYEAKLRAKAATDATAAAEALRAQELEEQVQQQTKELETVRATMRELEDRIFAVLSETTTSSVAAAAQATKIEALQAELEAQKADYEAKLQAMKGPELGYYPAVWKWLGFREPSKEPYKVVVHVPEPEGATEKELQMAKEDEMAAPLESYYPVVWKWLGFREPSKKLYKVVARAPDPEGTTGKELRMAQEKLEDEARNKAKEDEMAALAATKAAASETYYPDVWKSLGFREPSKEPYKVVAYGPDPEGATEKELRMAQEKLEYEARNKAKEDEMAALAATKATALETYYPDVWKSLGFREPSKEPYKAVAYGPDPEGATEKDLRTKQEKLEYEARNKAKEDEMAAALETQTLKIELELHKKEIEKIKAASIIKGGDKNDPPTDGRPGGNPNAKEPKGLLDSELAPKGRGEDPPEETSTDPEKDPTGTRNSFLAAGDSGQPGDAEDPPEETYVDPANDPSGVMGTTIMKGGGDDKKATEDPREERYTNPENDPTEVRSSGPATQPPQKNTEVPPAHDPPIERTPNPANDPEELRSVVMDVEQLNQAQEDTEALPAHDPPIERTQDPANDPEEVRRSAVTEEAQTQNVEQLNEDQEDTEAAPAHDPPIERTPDPANDPEEVRRSADPEEAQTDNVEQLNQGGQSAEVRTTALVESVETTDNAQAEEAEPVVDSANQEGEPEREGGNAEVQQVSKPQ